METIRAGKYAILKAVEILKNDGVIIFPTETVYGIGASIFSSKAIERLYRIKGRENEKPFQVLISSIEQLQDLASTVPSEAFNLMEKYWPGPLTMIFKKSDKLSSQITGGLETVGVRMPNDETILQIINDTGPIASSSANFSGKNPPTKALEVEINADLLIDGGESSIKEPSTIIDFSVIPPKILRQGSLKTEI